MFVQLRPALSCSIFFALTITGLAQTRSKPPMETISIRVSEGTELAFDVSPDRRSIVFDMLGQLWLIPSAGGRARAITDAVRDVAEDNDPSFSPDGRSVVFRGERNGKTGLFLLDIASGKVRQLTQILDPEGSDGNASWSPDGKSIVFLRAVLPDFATRTPGRMAIMLFDADTEKTRELSIVGLDKPRLSDPTWIGDGKEIAFVVRKTRDDKGGRVWKVPASGGTATAVTDESTQAQRPVFSSDGRRMAYFAPDGSGRTQVWVKDVVANGPTVRLSDNADVFTTRIRWTDKDGSLLYSADGRLWKVKAAGGKPSEVPFIASLSITRPKLSLPQAKFPEPGREEAARGFMGLALSPDAKQIAMLALGKLWVIPIGGKPKAVASVPFEAASLSWSPDGNEVVWSAGLAAKEDLFATNIATAATRQVTSLTGAERYPVYSPDGRYIAFVHLQNDDGVLRVVDARADSVTDAAKTRDLGSVGTDWTCLPQWSPESDGLVVCGGTRLDQLGKATFVTVSGARTPITRFPRAPIMLQWTPQKRLVFERHDRLWQAGFDRNGMTGEPQPIGSEAALYLSASKDGSLLFVSDGGLRLRSPNGSEQTIGWPVTYTRPFAEPMLIRNVRIIDGTGAPITTPRDILIERGRIARIAPTGQIATGSARVVDAGGRIVIPGLMDLHAHVYRPDLLPGWLYFGVMTIRDQGSSMGPLTSYASDIASGTLPGPRVSYGGFQFYSDWAFDEEQGRGIEPEADPDHIKRSVTLLAAFGAQHIKTRTFRRWDINARMIAEAHRYGMRSTGHCSHLLPLIAAGMNAKEHIGGCEERGNTQMYEDMIQLFKAAGIGVVPTISYLELAVRMSENPAWLDGDAELTAFMPAKESFDWMVDAKGPFQQQLVKWFQNSKTGTAKLLRAGIMLGAGTDIWQIPIGVHIELEQMVAAGLTPLQAIQAATGNSARILGADRDLGTVETGKWADLVILDADPLADIRNSRKIWNIVQSGNLVDRSAILKVMKPK